MEETRLLIPLLGMLLLTMLVWVYMYALRIRYMLVNKIPAQAGGTPEKMHQLLPDRVNFPAYNFSNLFEMPIVFYVVCGYLIWAGQVDIWHIRCAYAFFVLRALHSLIHCAFNHVLLRFATYFISSIAVWIMVIRAALAL